MTTYDRPIEAKLLVQLANGEEWEATPVDLEKFGLVKRLDAYITFSNALRDALYKAGLLPSKDITEARLNPVRYLAENAIVFPDLLTLSDHEDWKIVADLERDLIDVEKYHDAVAEIAREWDDSRIRYKVNTGMTALGTAITALVALIGGTEDSDTEGDDD